MDWGSLTIDDWGGAAVDGYADMSLDTSSVPDEVAAAPPTCPYFLCRSDKRCVTWLATDTAYVAAITVCNQNLRAGQTIASTTTLQVARTIDQRLISI